MPESIEIKYPNIKLDTITSYFETIDTDTINRYKEYWDKIKPTSQQEYYKRWMFAFLSVHTTWKANVKAYENLTADPLDEKTKLMKLITTSGVGLINLRTEGLWKFKKDFWDDPQSWYKKDDESWAVFRNRLQERCHGLGFAKSSFAIELCYPNECEVTCLDTHMLQLYGIKSSPVPSPRKYTDIEQHWISLCKENKYPAFMVRNIYWDKVQKQNDTRYWSYVFEK